jgi:hypothetical protein
MNVELDQLRKLPIAEKLRIVEQLWDDIAASDEPLVLRDWHNDSGTAVSLGTLPSVGTNRSREERREEYAP